MGTFNLISSSSMDRYNKAERLNLLTNFMALMPGANPAGGDGEESGGEGGSPLTNTQAPAATGVPALGISQEQVDRMNELIGQMSEQTMQTTSSAETPEMQQLEADRDVAANYIVRRIADYDRLPLAAEREAARSLEPVVRPYAGLADLPAGQETVVIRGLLYDLRKPQLAETVAALALTPYLDELERLNEEYARLSAERDKARSARTGTPDTKALTAEAQDLLDDMCALANASSLLNPSEEATTFIREANYLFAQARTAYKQRSKGTAKNKQEEENESQTEGQE